MLSQTGTNQAASSGLDWILFGFVLSVNMTYILGIPAYYNNTATQLRNEKIIDAQVLLYSLEEAGIDGTDLGAVMLYKRKELLSKAVCQDA